MVLNETLIYFLSFNMRSAEVHVASSRQAHTQMGYCTSHGCFVAPCICSFQTLSLSVCLCIAIIYSYHVCYPHSSSRQIYHIHVISCRHTHTHTHTLHQECIGSVCTAYSSMAYRLRPSDITFGVALQGVEYE